MMRKPQKVCVCMHKTILDEDTTNQRRYHFQHTSYVLFLFSNKLSM